MSLLPLAAKACVAADSASPLVLARKERRVGVVMVVMG
jgi:hypothetical protein